MSHRIPIAKEASLSEGGDMLTITRSAANVLDSVRHEQELPESFVVRVFAKPTTDGLEVDITFEPGPAEGDQVLESEGTTLCVDPDLVEPLADTVIDAEQTPQGPQLVFRR
jgi:iron-sulfur cluster assembly protein